MKAFEYLEHTADVKFKAYGETLEQAFSNAALALATVITEPKKIKPIKKEKIKVIAKGEDLKALLYKFLEELLVLLDSKSFLLHSVEKIKIDEKNLILEAELTGDKVKESYEQKMHVKAVTYAEMDIKIIKDKKSNRSSYELTVVIDI